MEVAFETDARIHFDDTRTMATMTTTRSNDIVRPGRAGRRPAGWRAGRHRPRLAKMGSRADGTAPSKPNVLKQSGSGVVV